MVTLPETVPNPPEEEKENITLDSKTEEVEEEAEDVSTAEEMDIW